MGAVSATAQRGRGAHGGLVARSLLRLLALLGFACVAVILCSTSANADGGNGGHEAAPASRPGLVPGLLKAANNALRPVVRAATSKDGEAGAAPATSPAVDRTPSPAATAPSASPAVSPVLAAAATAPTRSTVTPVDTAPVALPLHDVLTPVVDAGTHVVTTTVDVATGTTSSIPALGLATTLLRTVGTATTQLASNVGSLTTRVDTRLVSVVATTRSLVTPLTGGARPIPAAGSSSSAGTGASFAPTPVAATSGITVLGVLGPREPAAGRLSSFAGSGPGVLSAPPRTAGDVSAVQSVPAVVVAPAAPMVGAVGTAVGSVPGTAVGGSSGLHEQTEVPRGFDFRAVMAIGRACVSAVRPLPGTPLVDPGFSPD